MDSLHDLVSKQRILLVHCPLFHMLPSLVVQLTSVSILLFGLLILLPAPSECREQSRPLEGPNDQFATTEPLDILLLEYKVPAGNPSPLAKLDSTDVVCTVFGLLDSTRLGLEDLDCFAEAFKMLNSNSWEMR